MKRYSGKNLDKPKRSLPYASSTLSPIIEIPDVESFRGIRGNSAANHFRTRAKELEKSYQKLIEEVEINKMIYEKAEYHFQPIVGKVYFLYWRDYNDTYFLSIISPLDWDMFEFVGAFKFGSNDTWEEIVDEIGGYPAMKRWHFDNCKRKF